ncbi:MAG: response regulator [Planctomycetales bacterium]|nr:response regulator [Planctomycetales bacterium]
MTTRMACGTGERTLRVLVVDDEPDCRDVLGAALEAVGHEVRKASGALEALRLLGEGPADVVVTDLLMPGLRGESLAAILREDHPGVGIVVVTAWPTPAALGRLGELRVDSYLPKPLDSLDDLRAAVRDAAAARGW